MTLKEFENYLQDGKIRRCNYAVGILHKYEHEEKYTHSIEILLYIFSRLFLYVA